MRSEAEGDEVEQSPDEKKKKNQQIVKSVYAEQQKITLLMFSLYFAVTQKGLE